MEQKKITIQNKLGLHARAAMKFTDTASRFQSKITLSCEDRQADGKSIMDVMVIGASFGHEISLSADGKDEQAAIKAIEQLIINKFGEPE